MELLVVVVAVVVQCRDRRQASAHQALLPLVPLPDRLRGSQKEYPVHFFPAFAKDILQLE